MTCPPRYSAPLVGAVIVAVGAALVSTVRVAAPLVTMPKSLVTTTRNVAPLSAGTVLNVYVRAFAAAMFTPFRCHWYVSGAVPDAVTEKVADCPADTVA